MSQDQAVAMDFLGIEKGSVKNESQTEENPVTAQAKQEPVATEQMTSPAASAPAEGNKMNFSQAFSLFSKHFNEKGIGNAAVGRGENVYLGNGKEDVKGSKPVNEENVSTHLGLFSQQTGFGSLRPFPGAEQKGFASTTVQPWLSRGILPPNSPAMRSAVTSTPSVKLPTAQLTIFYAGAVNVYDDVPADKAQAIMLLADSGNPLNASFIKPASFAQQTPVNSPLNSIPKTSLSLQTSGGASEVATTPIPLAAGPNHQPIRKLQADLPIARKHSLQRFLEKRKDRLMTKAPYPASPAPMKSEIEEQSCGSASPLLLSCQSPSSLTSRSLSGGCCNENSVSQDPSAPHVSAYIS